MSEELIAAIRATQRLSPLVMGIDFAMGAYGTKPAWQRSTVDPHRNDREYRIQLTLELFGFLRNAGYTHAVVSIGGYRVCAWPRRSAFPLRSCMRAVGLKLQKINKDDHPYKGQRSQVTTEFRDLLWPTNDEKAVRVERTMSNFAPPGPIQRVLRGVPLVPIDDREVFVL